MLDVTKLRDCIERVLLEKTRVEAYYAGYQLQQDLFDALNYLDKHPDPGPTDPPFAAATRVLRACLLEDSAFATSWMTLIYPGGAAGMNVRRVSQALPWRARRIGPDAAASALAAYLASSTVDVTLNLAVGGVELTERATLAKGVEVVPWSEALASDDDLAWTNQLTTGRRELCTAVFRQTIRVEKRFGDVSPHTFMPPANYSDIEAALSCVCIAGPIPLYAIGKWVTPEDGVPAINYLHGWGSFLEVKPHIAVLSPSQASAAAELHFAFDALSTARRDLLSVPIRRLNSAMVRPTTVDAAIDLGIAMEALFIPEAPQGKNRKHVLSARAAHRLATNEPDADRIRRLFEELYQDRNIAVHRGRFASAEAEASAKHRLSAGYPAVARALGMSIRERIDWHAVAIRPKRRR